MKKCTICKIKKEYIYFFSNKGTKDGFGSQCKECSKIEKVKKSNDKKLILVNLLGGKCKICGYNKCIYAFDFHHISNKNFAISSKRYHSLETLISEIKNCELLCANCHREKHYMEYISKFINK